jgi:hypothetical protein
MPLHNTGAITPSHLQSDFFIPSPLSMCVVFLRDERKPTPRRAIPATDAATPRIYS